MQKIRENDDEFDDTAPVTVFRGRTPQKKKPVWKTSREDVFHYSEITACVLFGLIPNLL